jgi:hypothetical protein
MSRSAIHEVLRTKWFENNIGQMELREKMVPKGHVEGRLRFLSHREIDEVH